MLNGYFNCELSLKKSFVIKMEHLKLKVVYFEFDSVQIQNVLHFLQTAKHSQLNIT